MYRKCLLGLTIPCEVTGSPADASGLTEEELLVGVEFHPAMLLHNEAAHGVEKGNEKIPN